jgi:hypothetical protein
MSAYANFFDLGGAIVSFVESFSTPRENPELRPRLSPQELVYKVVFCFIVAWLLQFVLVGVYNSANHALADYPGPRAAAFTEWYKTYREFICGESWVLVLEELHRKYGRLPPPSCHNTGGFKKGEIVRVGPNEVCNKYTQV